jgi:hypothetical protein
VQATQTDPETYDSALASATACANCREPLLGEYCSRCGQRVRDFRRPFGELIASLLEDVFSLDSRLLRTVGPLVSSPGQVTRDYLAGHRVRYMPPLKAYLFAALVFFGLFTLFPTNARVEVFTEGSPEAAAAAGQGGSRVSFSLPARSPFYDEGYQKVAARARANPDTFASAVYANVPRTFFLLLPMFALLLELFYRRQGYYIDHLIFSLYYHAFVFLGFAALFVAGHMRLWMPGVVNVPLRLAVLVWIVAYLPMGLRRVYGGSRRSTGLKTIGIGILYLVVFGMSMPLLVIAALLTF